MTEEMVMSVGTEAIKTIMLISGPMLIAAMVVGIVVSVFQAITQVNEATLTFIPKMLAVILVMIVMGPWMMEVLRQYAIQVLGNAGELVR